MKEFDTVMDCDMNKGKISWFLGGKLNVSGNVVNTASRVLWWALLKHSVL